MEKSILEQANSKYELQGEYVFPGTRDRFPVESQSNGFIEKAMGGHLGSIMSSMGRWRMRLEVPGAEVAEMLPLARLLSRSTDPVIRSRSKVHIVPEFPLFLWLDKILVGVYDQLDGPWTCNPPLVFRNFLCNVCILLGSMLKVFVIS
jgi:hypothetical protein